MCHVAVRLVFYIIDLISVIIVHDIFQLGVDIHICNTVVGHISNFHFFLESDKRFDELQQTLVEIVVGVLRFRSGGIYAIKLINIASHSHILVVGE